MSDGWVMRDQLKDREFFDFGYEQYERFAEFMHGSERLGSSDLEVVAGSQVEWWRCEVFTKAMVDYSCGEPLDGWVPRIQGLLREGAAINRPDVFVFEIWRRTSVAALLELTNLQELRGAWTPLLATEKFRLRGPDVLIDYPGVWDDAHGEYVDALKLHQRFRDIAVVARSGDVDAASDLLTAYVRTHWYRGYRTAGWWGRHVRSRIYVGYWCFEAAALAKQYGLDDSALKGHKYYPWDLAHWFDD